MRESYKMVLTLLIIGVICGGLLSMVNGVTQPVIEASIGPSFRKQWEHFSRRRAS